MADEANPLPEAATAPASFMLEAAPPEPAAVRLLVHEVYLSTQGESTWAGLPCLFIRLTGCPLRCTWCDTEHAFYGGTRMSIDELLAEVASHGCPLVEVTGGEPLAQPGCPALLQALLDAGYTVLLETSGAISLENVPQAVHKIMDLKAPGSGECDRNHWPNIGLLAPHDEVKFVLTDRRDYEWARDVTRQHRLGRRCGAVLFSCVFGSLAPAQCVQWMLEDKLMGVRFQLQAHKFIWPPDTRGV